jgi:hypothetical protein
MPPVFRLLAIAAVCCWMCFLMAQSVAAVLVYAR